MKILVVVNGRNCGKYVNECLQSLVDQTYQDFTVVIVDDASNDNTQEQIQTFAQNKIIGKDFVILVSNEKNIGTALSRLKGEREAARIGLPYEIVVWVDMDDYLLNNALEIVKNAYSDPNCWLTYGNFISKSTGKIAFQPGGLELNPKVNCRFDAWKYVHLRTHRKGLTDHLTDQDIQPETYKAYPDINMLYCMLELAGDHAKAIYTPLYVYRDQHPNTCINQFSWHLRNNEKMLTKLFTPKKPLLKL